MALAHRAWREPARTLSAPEQPVPLYPAPRGAFFLPQNQPTLSAEITTDLLTPLGAYLRLREGAAASFLLESVERGRLGRHSFVGRGSRFELVLPAN